jgi:hypothetical protein
MEFIVDYADDQRQLVGKRRSQSISSCGGLVGFIIKCYDAAD